jgi:peptidoglycan/xylan/chitin deacetylase (PgdA/CDA1 family)
MSIRVTPKEVKRAAFTVSKRLGVFAAVRDGRWRGRRLLILGYHGISVEDEHEWNPRLYMKPAVFRARMALLRRGGYRVLSLDEAFRLLRDDTLPRKSVVITFDDGFYDFYGRAYPILREFELPATVYLTTYHCRYNRPVFGVVCQYLLWKGRGTVAGGRGIVGHAKQLDLRTAEGRAAAFAEIARFVTLNDLSAQEKDELAATLAERVHVDYDALLAKRILHLMNPDEARRVYEGGVDLQLHTHRHRTPSDRALFLKEIADNRRGIRAITRSTAEPSHFCYPSGVHKSEFIPWLEEAGVISAVTCDLGIASRRSSSLLLPRVLDSGSVSSVEFEAWLTGVASFVPRRAVVHAPD